MKVLAISHSCAADVNQQLFVELHALPDTKVEVIAPAFWKSEYNGQIAPTRLLPSVSFPVHLLPVAVPGHVSLHFYRRLPRRHLRRFPPDIIYSTQEPWSLSGLQAVWLARALRIPLVFHTNQNIWKRYPPPFGWIERLSYQTATLALAYSEEARLVMEGKGLQKPSRVVPYGTDVALFAPGDGAARRAALGLADKMVIGYLGRLVPEKGLDTLIEAAARVCRARPECNLAMLLVGSGPEQERLRQQASDLGIGERVVFAGAVLHSEAGEYMRCLDVFVLPSRTTPTWKEQFGRVIIEAMAAQVPVVGSDSGQIPHLVHDTAGGLVFREGDAADLSVKLTLLLDDPQSRRYLGETGRRAILNTYTFAATAQQTRAILKDALEASCR